jgi:hypothetical protein
MDVDIFLGIIWDYVDWLEIEKKEDVDRRIRIELNEWDESVFGEVGDILEEIVRELELDKECVKRIKK